MTKELICIVCPMGCHLEVDVEQNYSVMGNQCKRGIGYAKKELTYPTRTITSTVKIVNGMYNRIPVKTDQEISKKLIFDVMHLLEDVSLTSPVKVGDIVLKNVLGTGVNIVTTRSM